MMRLLKSTGGRNELGIHEQPGAMLKVETTAREIGLNSAAILDHRPDCI
jgi:hypothetical protein